VGLVADVVRVRVPATSANLGPGFDTLGLALGLHDELAAQVRPDGLLVEVEGEGADDVPRDERHLVVRAMSATFERLGERPSGLWLHCRNVVPHARGLGSSSAAIVGGVVLARALVDDGAERLDDAAALDLAAELEGHPDNVAPALLGGLTVAGHGVDGFWATSAPLDGRVGAVAFVPPTGVSTEAARGLLPVQVPHADAAANAARAALLMVALGGATEHLLRATDDLLHQGYREPAMPASLALVRALRADGVAAVVSGAGPTVLAVTTGAADAPGLTARCPEGWTARVLDIDRRGAVVLSER
jgi:homoserine kinase